MTQARWACASLLHPRQHDVRGMIGTVIDRVRGDDGAAVLLKRFAGVRVHVEAREVAAADVHTDAVA